MEENKQINLNALNLIELKALAYDEFLKLNVAQNNLKVINQELSKRQQQGVADASPVVQQ